MARTVTAALLTALTLIASVPARAASVANGSFEADVRAADTFCISFAAPSCGTVTGWTGELYLVNGKPQPITPPTPLPDGVQFAMVQSNSVMDQAVTIDVAGSYELSWSDAGRAAFIGAAGNESYTVSFGGTLLGSFSTTTGSAWASHSVVFSSGTGVFTLEIAGTTTFSQGDNSVLLDDFVLRPATVPEPGTLALACAGLAILACRRGSAHRRSGR
ncbi:MAG TPA: PEP-CTERM sorting domain-containing protein [Myxococcota bacterium]|nr:PEP-CTERM sorting domain-containing protein [Myxococcota bacterium]